MGRTGFATLILAVTGLAVAGPAQAADPPTPGGCKAFGQNVSGLATNPDVDFGANASGAATFYPGPSFPALVVRPEQERLCP